MERVALLTLVALAALNICWGLAAAVQAPFFPLEALRKGATASMFGPVFGIIHLSLLLTSPFTPVLISRLGLARVFLLGLLLASSSALAFGFLAFVDQLWLFLLLSYALRVVEGAGAGVLWSCLLSLLLSSHPSHPAAVYSFVDATFGLGFSLGPLLGSILFTLGGFLLPFLVCGAALLATGLAALPLVLHTAGPPSATSGAPASHRALLASPALLAALAAATTAALAIGFTESLLELHLLSFTSSVTITGLSFLLLAATTTATTVLAGLVSDALASPWLLLCCGLLLHLPALLLLGPAPFLPLAPSLTPTLLALALQGLGYASVLVSSYSCALAAVLAIPDYPRDVSTYSLVSSLWTMAFSLGNLLGPTIGGPLQDALGFPAACTVVAAVVAAALACLLVARGWVAALVGWCTRVCRSRAKRAGYTSI